MGNSDSALKDKFEDDFIENKRKAILEKGRIVRDDFEIFILNNTPQLLNKNVKRLKQMYKIKKNFKSQKDSIFKVNVIEHKKSKRLFLLKSIQKKTIINTVGMKNFLVMLKNMLTSVNRVRHPNIETVISISFDRKTMDESELFLVTNFTTKESLLDYMNSFVAAKKIIPDEQIAHIMQVLIQGAYQAKTNKIIVRGFSPETIFFQKANSIDSLCLCSFYFSEALEEEEEQTRGASGKLWFMSPEMLKDLEYDYRTDVWSLGVILYCLIFRSNPFKDCASKEQMLEAIKQKTWKKTHKDLSTLGINNEALILMEKMLDPNKATRPQVETILNDKLFLEFEGNKDKSVYESFIDCSSIDLLIEKIQALPELHNIIFYIIYNLNDYLLSREEISQINHYYLLFDNNNDGLVSFSEIENTLADKGFNITGVYLDYLKKILNCDFRRSLTDKGMLDYINYRSFLTAHALIIMFKEYSKSYVVNLRELAYLYNQLSAILLAKLKMSVQLKGYFKIPYDAACVLIRDLKEELEKIDEFEDHEEYLINKILLKLENSGFNVSENRNELNHESFEKRISNLFYEMDEDESGDLSIMELQNCFSVKYQLNIKDELKKIKQNPCFTSNIIQNLSSLSFIDFKNFFSYEIVDPRYQ